MDKLKNVVTHCENCTDFKKGSELPPSFTGAVVKSLRGVTLCPRCKSPSVMFEDKEYTKLLKQGYSPFKGEE